MVKKLLIIIFITSILFLVSCTNLDNYVPIEKYNEIHLAYVEAKKDSTDLKNENKSLKEQLNLTEEQLEKYQNLINNLNSLLENVYYVYDDNGETYVFGTGFSIEYKGKYYLITAGHVVDGEWGIHKNLGFKDIDDNWIYPELLVYENDFFGGMDYAILYSEKIASGLKYDLNSSYPKYILGNGNNNIFKKLDIDLIEGESGSPVIDIDGEVIEIVTGNYMDIDLVIEAIDDLE
jgi:hypothetical protein